MAISLVQGHPAFQGPPTHNHPGGYWGQPPHTSPHPIPPPQVPPAPGQGYGGFGGGLPGVPPPPHPHPAASPLYQYRHDFPALFAHLQAMGAFGQRPPLPPAVPPVPVAPLPPGYTGGFWARP